MNIITNSITLLTSIYPQNPSEALCALSAAGIGYGLAAMSGICIAGVAVVAGIALKRGVQGLARLYLKSLPTLRETKRFDRKLEDLKFHALCQAMTIDSFTVPKHARLISECDALGRENLTSQQRDALVFLKRYIDRFPAGYQRFLNMEDLQERDEWLKAVRDEAIRGVRIPLAAIILADSIPA